MGATLRGRGASAVLASAGLLAACATPPQPYAVPAGSPSARVHIAPGSSGAATSHVVSVAAFADEACGQRLGGLATVGGVFLPADKEVDLQAGREVVLRVHGAGTSAATLVNQRCVSLLAVQLEPGVRYRLRQDLHPTWCRATLTRDDGGTAPAVRPLPVVRGCGL